MRFSYWLFIVVLIFAPLAFGSVELWSLSIIELLTGLSAVILLLTFWFYRTKTYVVPGFTPLLLLLAFMVMQTIPLPPGVVGVISPFAHNAYAPILSLNGDEWIPLSINQKATLQELLRITCYFLVYFLTVQLLCSSSRLKSTVQVIVVFSAGIALLAILQNYSSPDKIYWFRPAPGNSQPFGPWINPNQFSGFMEMIFPLSLALFLYFKPRIYSDETWREKVVNVFSRPSSDRYMLFCCSCIIISLSVFISLCRGGILTLVMSTMVFTTLFYLKKRQQGKATAIVILSVIFLSATTFGWDIIAAEFNRGVDAAGELNDSRFAIWKDTIKIIQDVWLVGGGFGTFVDIFPAYRDHSSVPILYHAHNDYLELLTDGGVIGFGLAGWFVVVVLRHGWKMVRLRRDKYAVLIGIGAITGIVAMLMHSVTDFNMHNEAVGLYLFFLCGVLVSSVNMRFEYNASRPLLKTRPKPLTLGLLCLAVVFTCSVGLIQYGGLRGNYEFHKISNIYINPNLNSDLIQQLRRALSSARQHDPFESLYSYKLGTLEWYAGNQQATLNHYADAARKRPMNGAALQGIGLLVESDTEMFLKAGYVRDVHTDERALTYAEYLLGQDQRVKAIEVIQERLYDNTSLISEWLPLFEMFSFTREEGAALLPKSVAAWIKYGDFRLKLGDTEGADYFLGNALSHMENEEQVEAWWFKHLIRYYKKQDHPEKALHVLRQAVEVLPDDSSFHVQMGDYYLVEGITYRAQEEYEQALMLDPGNVVARKRLRKMGLRDAY